METQLMFNTDKLGSLLQQRSSIEDYGGTTSPSFKLWVREIRKEIRRACKANDGKLLRFNGTAHYFWSAFVQGQSGQIWYISCSDVRHFPNNDIMYRTAQNDSDYTGGGNQYCTPDRLSETIAQLCC